MLDDLFTYRLADCEFLTVTNAANHERDLAWMQAHAGGFDVDVLDRAADFAMLAVQGPKRARARRPARRRPAAGAVPLLPARGRGRRDARRAAPATRARTGSSCCSPPSDAPAVWDALVGAGADPGRARRARHPAARGLLSTSTATTWARNATRSRPGSAGAARRTPASSAPRRSRRRARDGTAEKLVPFVIEGAGIARQGNPVVGGGVVTSGTFSPCLERGIGMAYVSSARAQPGTPIEIDVRGRTRPAVVERKPLYRKGA